MPYVAEPISATLLSKEQLNSKISGTGLSLLNSDGITEIAPPMYAVLFVNFELCRVKLFAAMLTL